MRPSNTLYCKNVHVFIETPKHGSNKLALITLREELKAYTCLCPIEMLNAM